MALRRIPIHRAGNRPSLFMGGDRELVMFSGLVAGLILFAAVSRMAYFLIPVGIVFWVGALFVFRLMAKSDPLLRTAYIRHLLYKRYYPARSTPFRANTDQQKKQYKGIPPKKRF